MNLGKFIRSYGGKKVAPHTWDVPTDKALIIIHRPDVYEAVIIRDGVTGAVTIPGNLDSTLGDIAKAHSNRVVGAAQYAMFARGDKVVVGISAPNAATIAGIRAWMKQRNIYALPASETTGAAPEHLAVLLPVKYITVLGQAYTTTRFEVAHYKGQGLTMSRTHWPQETKDFENTIVNKYVQGATTTAPPARHNTPKEWEVDLTAKLALHGVDRWHAMGYTGKDVKVGIIDWTFTDWNKAAKRTKLPTMVKGAEKGVANANAYCQPITKSIVPDSRILLTHSHSCEPTPSSVLKITHGAKVGQLILDMAPDATLYLAQANSPRQLYDAAVWLKSKGVDVIVHAGGWPYDSRGDGTAYFDLRHYNDTTLHDINEDSPRRYYPSPLYTVDAITGGTNGPVWINAAGNAEEWTLNLKTPSLVNDGDSDYHGYVIFHPNKKKHKDQTCQKWPIIGGNVYYLSMRWADSWPNGNLDMEYDMQRQVLGFGSDYLVQSELRVQHTTGTNNYPVRRTPVLSWKGYDVCLRIKVTTPDDETPVVPAWVQFQALLGRGAFDTSPNWANADLDGHSMVNPAESANNNLIAVGAHNMRMSTTEVTDYSSRGPVFAKGGNIISTSPGRIKPDLVAGSHTATYINWPKDCRQGLFRTCGDGIYLKGTTGATGHTGGLAAVVVGYYDQIGLPLTSTATANLLRLIAVNKGNTGTGWGQGFLKLPCPPKTVTLPYTSSGANWAMSDCDSEVSSGRSDYYVFNVPSARQVTIELDSSTHAYLRLARGAHSKQSAAWIKTNGSSGGVVTLKHQLPKGTYTLEVAANSASATGTYTLKIMNQGTTPIPPNTPAPVTPEGYLSPAPSGFDFNPDGKWHAFTVSANVPVNIIANPTGSAERMEVATSNPGRTYCPPEPNDDVTRANGQTVYLAGCTAGSGVIEVRSVSGNKLLAQYATTVASPQVTPSASLSPRPASFKADGKWQAFTVSSNVDVEVEVNPTGTTPRVELTTSSNAGNHCSNGAEEGDDVSASNGDTIYLAGCTSGTGTIRLLRESDGTVITTYTVTIASAAVRPRASLSPRPTSLKTDGKWQAFTVSSNVDVEVEVNPIGTTPRVEITTSSSAGNHCSNGAENSDDVDASNGDTIYLTGCTAGTGTVRLLKESDGTVITTYTVTITTAVVPKVCKPVTNFKAVRVGNNAVKTTWANPSGGKTVTGKLVQVRKWNSSTRAWQNHVNISESASATSSWHIGASADSYFSYRVFSKCGASYSLSSGWKR